MCGVATQGDGDFGCGDEWVIDFKLSYSLNENNWTICKDGDGTEVVRLLSLLSFKRKSDKNCL